MNVGPAAWNFFSWQIFHQASLAIACCTKSLRTNHTLTFVTVSEVPACIEEWGQLKHCVQFTSQLCFITMFSIFVTQNGCRSFPRNGFMFVRLKIDFSNLFWRQTVKWASETPSRCIKRRHLRLNINPNPAFLPFCVVSSCFRTEEETKNIPNCSSASSFCHFLYNFFISTQGRSGAERGKRNQI